MDVLQLGEDFLRQVAPGIKEKHECHQNGWEGCWFINPKRWFLENIVMWTFLFASGIPLMKKWLATLPRETKCTAYPIWVRCWITMTACVVVLYKLTPLSRCPFILMPCHVTMLLLAVTVNVPSERARYVLSRCYCQTFVFVMAPLVTPDLRDLDLPCEFNMFWKQHLVLPLMSIYMVLTGRSTPSKDGWLFCVANCLLQTAFYFSVPAIASIMKEESILYMLKPPPPFEFLGENYRVLCCFGCMLMFFAANLCMLVLEKFRSEPRVESKKKN